MADQGFQPTENPDAYNQRSMMKICIIGGGAAGLAILKIIKDSDEFKSGAWAVNVYEERDDIGGTWCAELYLSYPALC